MCVVLIEQPNISVSTIVPILPLQLDDINNNADFILQVTVENQPCGSTGVTCAKSVVIELDGETIKLMKGGAVYVGNEEVKLPKIIRDDSEKGTLHILRSYSSFNSSFKFNICVFSMLQLLKTFDKAVSYD